MNHLNKHIVFGSILILLKHKLIKFEERLKFGVRIFETYRWGLEMTPNVIDLQNGFDLIVEFSEFNFNLGIRKKLHFFSWTDW